MTILDKTLVAGSQIAATATTYYTAPANTRVIITNISLTNTTANAVTATVHIIPVGATESASNMIISARTLAPGETYSCPMMPGKHLDATGTIRALAGSATSITIQASGYEVT